MLSEQLNQHIKNYLENDKTNSAIMLTGAWGTGKSYYIKNQLIPFLDKDNEGRCVIVSLYGIKDLKEISKAIYLEERTRKIKTRISKFKLFRKVETQEGAKIVGKTILKGVTSFFGVDLKADENSLQALYESVDLTGKLIILEDLERCSIDIVELLGFVNNLVEQDGVKVLLVANENEIIKSKKKEVSVIEKPSNAKDYTQKNINITTSTHDDYKKIKEKTVSDTIIYSGDLPVALKEIIKSFGNAQLSAFCDNNSINEVESLCIRYKIFNLRSFVFACQKTVDIYQKLLQDFPNDNDFLKTIFYSIVIFSNRIKNGEKIAWVKDEMFSVELGTEDYPLFRFCYDYIMWHQLYSYNLNSCQDALKTLRLYDRKKSSNDKDLSILYNIWRNKEKDVIESVNSVTQRLANETDISFYQYGRLAVYLLIAKHTLGCDVEKAKNLLISNLYNKGHEISAESIFNTVLSDSEKPELISEYKTLKDEMTASLYAKECSLFDFDYQPSGVAQFYQDVLKGENEIYRFRAFASRLNVDKIIEMLKLSTASQIEELRGAFIAVYRPANIGEYFIADYEPLKALFVKVKELQSYSGYDAIQKKQIDWFVENISDFISKLEPYVT